MSYIKYLFPILLLISCNPKNGNQVNNTSVDFFLSGDIEGKKKIITKSDIEILINDYSIYRDQSTNQNENEGIEYYAGNPIMMKLFQNDVLTLRFYPITEKWSIDSIFLHTKDGFIQLVTPIEGVVEKSAMDKYVLEKRIKVKEIMKKIKLNKNDLLKIN